MQNLSSAQKLDLILSCLKDYPQSINEIEDCLGFERKYGNEIRTILNKLTKDEYADEIKSERRYEGYPIFKPTEAIWDYSYKISFEGEFLREQGGYKQQKINNTSESIRLENHEKNQKFHRKALTWLTSLVAVGTLVAGVFYLIEIGRHFHWWK